MVSLADAALVWCASLSPPVFAAPGREFEVTDPGDGSGPAVTRWDATKLGPLPSAKALAAITADQVAAYRTGRARAAALALLADPGAAGKALRAVLLAAGLTPAQVQSQITSGAAD
jgi:hypothetical protein